MNKRLKRMGLLFGMSVLGVAFSVGIAVSAFGGVANSPARVNAAGLETELKPAIKINVDIGEWGWKDLKLYYFNAKSDASETVHSPVDNGWPGVALTDNAIVLPATIHHADVIVVGSEAGIDNKQTVDITDIDGPGEYLIDEFAWPEGASKATVTVSRSGDFTVSAYKTTAGHTGGIDSSRIRVWLDRGHFGESGITAMNIGDVLHQPSGYVQVRTNAALPWFPYFDLPKTLIGQSFHFVQLSGDLTLINETSTALTFASGDNNYLFYLPSENQTGDETLNKGTVLGEILNTFFAKVLEGYLTCIDSVDNGYGAFNVMDSSFLPRTVVGEEEIWYMSGNLGGLLIADYESQANYASGTRESTASTDALEKYDALRSRYNAANPSDPTQNIGYFDNNNAIAIIIGIALVGLTSLAGLYVLKRKRA